MLFDATFPRFYVQLCSTRITIQRVGLFRGQITAALPLHGLARVARLVVAGGAGSSSERVRILERIGITLDAGIADFFVPFFARCALGIFGACCLGQRAAIDTVPVPRDTELVDWVVACVATLALAIGGPLGQRERLPVLARPVELFAHHTTPHHAWQNVKPSKHTHSRQGAPPPAPTAGTEMRAGKIDPRQPVRRKGEEAT
jgi:hypothetical protein